jgi:ParB family chromosome partitioning protein
MKLKTGGNTAFAKAMKGAEERDPLFRTSKDFPRLIEVDVADCHPRADQPRRLFDEEALRELAASIERQGQLQPIIVRARDGEGGYEIVAGERRWRACRLAGRQTIFAVVTTGQAEEIALVENLQRVDLTAVEEARGLKSLIDRHGFTQEQAAAAIGKSRTQVNTVLRLLDLPPAILEDMGTAAHPVSKAVMLQIAREKDPAAQARLWEAARRGVTDREARAARVVKQTRAAPAPAQLVGLFFRDLAKVEKALPALAPAKGKLDEPQKHRLRELRRRLDELLGDA